MNAFDQMTNGWTPLEKAAFRAMGERLYYELNRKRNQHGKVDGGNLAPQFILYFQSQSRIEVAFCGADGSEHERKRGTVSITGGWKPSFMLMLRRNSQSSSWLLGDNDKVIRTIETKG